MLACVSATGATVAERSSSALKKPANSVLGATIVCSTGCPSTTSRRSAPIASFSCGPRPASALPKPARFCRIAFRVGSSNMSKNWSMSTGSGFAERHRDPFRRLRTLPRTRRA